MGEREGRGEFPEVLLEDLQAEVERESCGSTSVKLSLSETAFSTTCELGWRRQKKKM